ncbi:MAG: ABC transporter ATP-binding protein, partial [Deltaproteobacteria bacterium]|nr:ABC transporter ATP-binding protein [Deltaproteobacteria bacterium]
MNTSTCDPSLGRVGAFETETAEALPGRGIWALMRPVRNRIHLAMGLAALGAVAALAAVAVLAVIIAQLLGPDPNPWPWAAVAILLTVISFYLRTQGFTVSHLAAFRLETILRTKLADRMARVPLGYLLQTGTGTVTKVMQDDVKSLHAFVADTTPMIGRSVATPLATLILMLIIDWRLALLALGLLVVGTGCVMLAMRGSGELQRRYDEERERIAGAVVEFVQAMPVVRTFDDGASSFGRYQSALDGFRDVLAKWLEVSAVSAKISILILGPLPTLLALALGGVLLFT